MLLDDRDAASAAFEVGYESTSQFNREYSRFFGQPPMKIGLYGITYRGVWYRGQAVDVFSLVRLARQQGWEGLELDTERPHAAPMDLSADDRKRLRDLAGEVGIELCAVSPNCDLSSPVPVQREAMKCLPRPNGRSRT